MQIKSRQLGEIDVNPEEILEFPNGVPGFERARRFILVERSAYAPIVFLQSVDSPELCFVTAPIDLIDPAYQLAATAEDLDAIGWSEPRPPETQKEVICLGVLAAGNGRWTANLLAPIVIEPQSRRAVQAVRADARYSHQHPIQKELKCS